MVTVSFLWLGLGLGLARMGKAIHMASQAGISLLKIGYDLTKTDAIHTASLAHSRVYRHST